MRGRPFQKGHKLAKGSNGQLRRDLTVELISQLNEYDDLNYTGTGAKRDNLHRIVENLILHAKGTDPRAKSKKGKGKVIGRDKGDVTAILAIWDRLEGRPASKKEEPETSPVKIEYRSVEEVRMFLTLDFLLGRKKIMSQASWESEYQQHPIIVGGGMFPIEKFSTIDMLDRKQIISSCRYWDKAGTQGACNESQWMIPGTWAV